MSQTQSALSEPYIFTLLLRPHPVSLQTGKRKGMEAEKRRSFGWPGPRWTRMFFASAWIISGAAANSSESYRTIQDNEPTCTDFADRRFTGLSWTFDDCVDVWSAFRDNISRALNIRPPHVDAWKATADELRQAGKPCMLTSFLNSYSNAHGVGVGSTTWKHLATWILAEETGCDWVTPSWTSFNGPARNETATYCHWMKGKTTTQDGSSVMVLEKPCVSVNWLAYFNFGVPSTALPEGITLKNVTVSWRVVHTAAVRTLLFVVTFRTLSIIISRLWLPIIIVVIRTQNY